MPEMDTMAMQVILEEGDRIRGVVGYTPNASGVTLHLADHKENAFIPTHRLEAIIPDRFEEAQQEREKKAIEI